VAVLALGLTLEARLGQVDLEVFDRPTIRLLQRDVNLVAVICATDGASRTLLEPTEHLTEDVVHVGARATLGGVGASKLVEVLALLGIGQDVVRALDLFELLWITAFVWVVLHSKFSVSLLYVSIRGSPLDP
jgi:hypothetical protein